MAVLSVVFAASAQLWVLLAVSAGRGVGFGLVTVTSSLLIAVLLPEAERGRGSGRYGAAVGLPNIVGLPAGVWLTSSGHPGSWANAWTRSRKPRHSLRKMRCRS